MSLPTHSLKKYSTGTLIAVEFDTNEMRVETWQHGAGRLSDTRLAVTEVAVMLRGHVKVDRTGDGRRQSSVAGSGAFWLCPAGVSETDIVVSDVMEEVIHFFLPADLLGRSALEEFGVDSAAVHLDYAGGEMDPLLTQIALSFREMRRSPTGLTDGLFADSLRTMLAAHLLRRYLAAPRSIEAGKTRREKMDARRLRHVLDLVESRLGEPLQLREMAGAACLSPFHFSRIFRLTMGISPYQYVLDRRIEGAKRMLHAGHFDLVEIALRTGFGSQSNFNRAFKKSTGTTPGAFRGRV